MGSAGAGRVRYRLGRRPRSAPAGRTLAAELADGRSPLLQRSIRYHRPRAPFCGTGACTNCLVRVNGVPNVRACQYAPADGDRVEFENAWPSPEADLLGLLDPLFPGGIDSVRGFRRPAFARPLYQWVVRHLAAFGRLPDAEAAPIAAEPAPLQHADAVVVGAGPEGRAAATRLVEGGLRPVVLDRGRVPPPALAGAELRSGTLAAFLPPPDPKQGFDLLAVDGAGRGARIATPRVIVATGGFDAALWFANADRPGVLTLDGAEALVDPQGRPPFHRALLFGGERRAAEALERWGAAIEAVAAPGAIAPEVVRAASDHGVPLYPRTLLRRVDGRRRVASVSFSTRGRGPSGRLEVDAVVLAHRRLPNNPILFQSGARMRWSPVPGAYFPVRAGAATTVPGLAVAGRVAGVEPAGAPPPSGIEAAERLLKGDPWPRAPDPEANRGPSEMEGYYRELLALEPGRGRWVACPCEDVLLPELRAAHERGYRGIEVLKRYTGLGTGLCQGRYCLSEALLALAVWERRLPDEVGYITQRPPVMPVPLGALAALPARREDP